MKAIPCLILCPLAVCMIALMGRAQAPTTGRVLILDNDRILEGDIERVGEQYRIRRPAGETWLPVKQARVLCGSMETAYVYLRDRANLEDPDERLRLAHWCRRNHLPDQALHEATSAQNLRPSHEPTRRLVQLLQRPEPAAAEPPPTASVPPPPPPPVDFNSETLGLFVTKVQPILMNTCVNCHGGGKGGAFQLTRAHADTQANPRAIRYNLAAVMAQVRRDQPKESPLLNWSVTVHGRADKAPIKDRQAAAFRALEDWVKLAVQGPATRAAPPPPLPTQPEVRLEPEPIRPASEPFAVGAPVKPEPAAEPTPTMPAPSEAEPKPMAVPADPFDPAHFNQQNPRY